MATIASSFPGSGVLAGQVALLMAASRGIGRAISR
jgi:hypothetical protein